MSSLYIITIGLLIAIRWPSVSLESNDLPDIKSRLGSDLNYHVMFQMQMKSIGFSSIIIEEWGNLKTGQFRLDLVEDRQRFTYLFLGPFQNNDIYLYKPFVCQYLNLDFHQLYVLKNLFSGCGRQSKSMEKPSVQAFGFGPLWMLAKDNVIETSVDYPSNSTKDEFSKPLIGYYLKKWQNPDSIANYTYKLYFTEDTTGFLDMVEWRNKRGGSLLGRAKLVKFKSTALDQSIFDLPVGYGCERSNVVEKSSNMPDFELWTDGEPSEALFEVVTSRLLNEELNKWETHQSTCHIIHATMRLHNRDHTYYVAQEEFRPDRELERLSHMRHVTSSVGGTSQLLIFSIDDATGSCETRRDDLSNLVTFPFSDSSMQLTPQSTESIDLNLLRYLVEDKKDYHLIQELDDSRNELVYEKRLPANQQDLYNWNGPVSIVKRFSKDPAERGSRQIIQVFFYSDDLDKLLRKLFIELIDHGKVGMRTVHEFTDISACFEAHQKESILVKYSIESPKLAAKLTQQQSAIFQNLLLNIVSTTSLGFLQLAKLEGEVDAFNVEARMTVLDLPLTLTFDRFEGQTLVMNNYTSTVLEQMALGEEACASSCARYNCYVFSYDWSKQRCLIELSERVVEAAKSDTSNLYKFPQTKDEQPSVWSQLCVDPNVPESLHLSPKAIVACFKQLLSYESRKDKELVPLSLVVFVESKKDIIVGKQVILRPTEVVSESDPLDLELDNLHEAFVQVEYVVFMEEVGFVSESIKEHFSDISYKRCSQLCADADCRSFAYSEVHQTCDLTNLHKTENIKRASKSVTSSCIYVLDYLSKFQDLGWALKVENYAGLVKTSSEQDCATACMEETRFACQGFYQCSNSICLMQDIHIMEDRSMRDNLSFNNNSRERQIDDRCRFFSRSYLSQFGKLYSVAINSKALDIGPNHRATVGAEGCAKWCIERGCVAFDVCHQSSYHGSMEPYCTLAHKVLTSDMVEANNKCNTFLLADKSQFNHLHDNSPDKLTDVDEKATVTDVSLSGSLFLNLDSGQDLVSAYLSTYSQVVAIDGSVEGGSLYMDVFAMFMGLLLGVCLGLAYVKRHTLIGLAIGMMDS